MKFAWIQTEKARYPLTKLCRWLGVTPSGFYAWRQRFESVRRGSGSAVPGHPESTHARGGPPPEGAGPGVIRREQAAVRQSAYGTESTHARDPQDRRLKVLVQASFAESKQRYGSPRIHEDLIEQTNRSSA